MKILRIGIGIVEVQSANLLRTIAYAEIFLFPLLIITIFRFYYKLELKI